MNILVTSRELDMTGYDMLGRLSLDPLFNVYIAISSKMEKDSIRGNCVPVMIPILKSKFVFKAVKALRRIIKLYHIDMIFSPSSAGLSNALFASWGMKVKNVGYRGTQAKVKRTDPTYYLSILNPWVNHIVCETPDIYEYLSSGLLPERKLSVNLKPFDVSWVKDACEKPKRVEGIPDDAVTCVYIGSCKGRPFKGLSTLVEAFHLLDNPKAHLIFVGDYDESDYVLAKNGKSGERIHFLGYRRDALYFLPQRDIFILPSLRDASPRVVREAMACGLPCVVSDIPGARDLIKDGVTGILTIPKDSEHLSLTIKRLIEDKDMRLKMGKAGRERIIRDFDVNRYAQNFKKLFENLADSE